MLNENGGRKRQMLLWTSEQNVFCFLINLGTIISLRAAQIMSGIFFLCGFSHCNLSLHVFCFVLFFGVQHMVKVMETGV